MAPEGPKRHRRTVRTQYRICQKVSSADLQQKCGVTQPGRRQCRGIGLLNSRAIEAWERQRERLRRAAQTGFTWTEAQFPAKQFAPARDVGSTQVLKALADFAHLPRNSRKVTMRQVH